MANLSEALSTTGKLPCDEILLIHQLYAVQAHAIDSGDVDTWARTFTPDGTMSSPNSPVPIVGHDALMEFARTFLQRAGQYGTCHWTDAILITGGTDSTVRATANMLLLRGAPDGQTNVDRCVRAEDCLVRRSDGWLFQSRVIHPRFG
jgi:actinorhodin biosynthesis protein ActVIA